MTWIAPSEKNTDNAALEKRLWDAADQFRANSGLKSQEYSAPVLGLIFLRFAEVRFAAQRAKLEKGSASRAKIQEIFGGTSSASPKSKTLNSQPSTLNYRDIAGLCRAAALKEIEAQGWSLNPGRYVGVAAGEAVSDEDFKEQLETLNEELETLNAAARELEATIASNVTEILEA